MANAQFPQIADLHLPVEKRIGDGTNFKFGTYSVEKPHPGFGKDPNIGNEFGHTHYPKWVKNKSGTSVVANNAEQEAEILEIETELKQDGPTVEEFVKAGYKPIDYPPKGYASKSTQEEIDAAIKAATGWK